MALLCLIWLLGVIFTGLIVSEPLVFTKVESFIYMLHHLVNALFCCAPIQLIDSSLSHL